MNDKQKLEFDKMCAVFMGYDINRIIDVMPHKKDGEILSTGSIDDDGKRCNLVWSHSLRYHYDWNCLMKVIKRIREVLNTELDFSDFDDHRGLEQRLNPYDYDIESIRKDVTIFIEWYNENKELCIPY